MKKFVSLLLFIQLIHSSIAQDSPYKMRPLVDIPVTVGLGGTALLGFNYLTSKDDLDSLEIVQLSPEDVNRFDRSATHQRSSTANTIGDFGMYGSFLAGPIFILATKNTRKDFKTAGVIYLETMMVMANVYLWGVGSIERTRPYLYNPDVPIQDKITSHTSNSFFAGHPAATAASTFCIAKMFHDYYPNSTARKFVWAGAIVPPAVVAYCRYKYGEHFPTDILVGIPLGAAIGIVIPQLHKIKSGNEKVQFYPAPGGFGMVYKLN